jgi:dihydropyrimidine dehydrogenase (NAD+) subunit PreA
MANLSVEFAGVHFRNPLICASTIATHNEQQLKELSLAGAGGIIPKSIGSPSRWFQHPRRGRIALYNYRGIPIGMGNIEIFSTIKVRHWIEHELKYARKGGAKLIVSIVASPNPSETAKLARKIADTRSADMLELNVSCPTPADTVGMWIGSNPRLVAEQVKTVKEEVPEIPLMPKLTPNVSNIADIAKAAEKAGADAISAINSVKSLIGIDVDTGRPILPAFSGYSGPAIKPISLRCAAEVAKAVKIPISGVGGISTWRDAVEMIMAGAKTFQVGTALIWKGLGIIKELIDGIEIFMKKKGYDSVEEFVGMALPHLNTVEELSKLSPLKAQVDDKLCNGCQLCVKLCPYDAIEMMGKRAYVDAGKCDGCGLCSQFCSTKAIKLFGGQHVG